MVVCALFSVLSKVLGSGFGVLVVAICLELLLPDAIVGFY